MKRAAALLLTLLGACNAVPHHRVLLTPAWQWTAPAPAYVGMPTTNGDEVAVTFGHSYLVLLRAGREVWRTGLVGLRDVAPTFDGDRLLAATDDGVAAFARGDGRLLWSRPLGDRASTPVVSGDHTVVSTWDGRVIALDHWSVQLPGSSLGPPATADGIVVAAWDQGVLALDAMSGRELWRHRFDGDGTSAPAIVGRRAVVIGPRGAHAFDLRTGQPRWSLAMGAGSPEAPPAADHASVALVDRGGHLIVADARSGRRLWSADTGAAVVRGGPRFAAGVVVVPLDDGRLFVARRRASSVLDPAGRVAGVAVLGHTIVFATREGAANGVFALRPP